MRCLNAIGAGRRAKLYEFDTGYGRMLEMSDFTYGVTLLFVGMGGTLVSLGIIILVIRLLKRILPYSEAEEKGGKEKV